MVSKLKTFISYIFSIVPLVKGIIELVEIAEDKDFGDEKNGEKKKKFVLKSIEVVYDTGEEFLEIPIAKETLLDLTSKLIDVVVEFYNLLGKFRD